MFLGLNWETVHTDLGVTPKAVLRGGPIMAYLLQDKRFFTRYGLAPKDEEPLCTANPDLQNF